MMDTGGGRPFAADDAFRMPDLESALPRNARIVALAPMALRFSYFDTADLRLTRAGLALWFQRSTDHRFDREHPAGVDATPWWLRIGGQTLGFAGSSSTVPSAVASVLTGYTRGAALGPVAV